MQDCFNFWRKFVMKNKLFKAFVTHNRLKSQQQYFLTWHSNVKFSKNITDFIKN